MLTTLFAALASDFTGGEVSAGAIGEKRVRHMKNKRKIIVLGMAGRTPFAGVAWQVLHYLEGFRRLGHEVYYIEDTLHWPFDLDKNATTDDSRYTVSYIARLMAWCGMGDRWAYRAVEQGGRIYGLSESQFTRVFEEANVLINVPASTELYGEHLRVPMRVYLETDPVFPQIEVAEGRAFTIDLLSAHTHHFTYGENLGAPDCGVPLGRFHYFPTRQPIVLDWWSNDIHRAPATNGCCYTSVANWEQSGKDIEWNGELYTWSKHHEFLKFIDLPRRSSQPLELALSKISAEARKLLQANGWRVADAFGLSKEIMPYRDYIRGSRGEFTVAKDQNVRLRSGWFSDRSACYLAAGRPVITQDTGFGTVLPTGEGLFTFNTIEEILAAFEVINSDYEKHSRAARLIAEGYFRAETVLAKLLEHTGL